MFEQAAVERDHAELRAGLHVALDHVRLVVADAALDGRRGDHDLEGGDTAVHLAVRFELRQEDLGDHGLQTRGELRADLLLLVRRERIDDTVDGLRRAGGVQGAEHEVARFGGGDGRADGLKVAHFAHEDHVRVLAERAADRLGEAWHVIADLALRDKGFRGRVVEFDRVLNRDDVHAALVVDHVEHRGERGRFTGTGRARHEDETARLEQKLLHGVGKADLLEREQLRRNHTEHRAPVLALLEHTHTETRTVLMGKSEVRATVLLHLGQLLVGADLAA